MTGFKTKRFQNGASLMEVLIAMSISLVVTASMVALMGNSLGTTARIIKMTKMTDDMRTAMQMMSRDVRRTNYNVDAFKCYANENCLSDGALVAGTDVTLVDGDDDGTFDCFWFTTDRNSDNYDSAIEAGGFRHVPAGNVGVLEMWTGTGAPPATICNPDIQGEWVQVTDPEAMNIAAFSVDDDLSYSEVIFDDGTTSISQQVRKIRMDIQAQLVLDPTIQRRVEDIISIRNGLLL